MIRVAAAALVFLLLAGAGTGAGTQAARLGREAAMLEERLAGLRAELRALTTARAETAGPAGEKSRRALAVLTALGRLSSAPPAAFLLHPDGPHAGLLGAAALRASSGALQRQARDAQDRLRLIEALGRERDALRRTLRATASELRALTSEITRLRGGEAALRLAAATNAAREARSLTAALEGMKAVAAVDAPPPPWPWPIPLLGAQDQEGGLSLRVAAGALALSPTTASLRFAGRIPGRGGVAVLEPQTGVLIVLAGLGRIDAPQGATLAPGEPFGAMAGARREITDETDATLAAKGQETLYIELRRDGALEDPRAWFGPSERRNGG